MWDWVGDGSAGGLRYIYVEHQCGGKNDQMLPLPSAQQAPRDGRRRRTQRPLCLITSVSGSDQENIESQVLIEKIFVNFGNRHRRQ